MNKGLLNHFVWLANRLSVCYLYDVWSSQDKEKELKEGFSKFYNSLKLESNKNLIDFEKLTVNQARELGFQLWSDDNSIDEDIKHLNDVGKICRLNKQRNLWLIPLYLYPLLPNGFKLTTVSGVDIENNEQLDLETRYGCLAYGIHIKEETE